MNVPLIPTNYYFNDILVNAINAGAPAVTKLSAAKLMLGTVFLQPGLLTTYAELTEATFTGYAQSATVVWGTPINDVDTTPTSQSPSHLFRCTAGGVTNQIYNMAVTDGVVAPGTGILASAAWTPPIVIANAGDGFSVLVDWNLGNVPGNLNVTIVQ